MLLKQQYKGAVFAIYAAILDDNSCPAIDFLETIKRSEPSSHKSITSLIERHADYGPIKNLKKSRSIEGYEGLFEFKSRQGARLIYFYLPGSRTILANGFCKGEPTKPEFQKAKQIRKQCIEEENSGNK